MNALDVSRNFDSVGNDQLSGTNEHAITIDLLAIRSALFRSRFWVAGIVLMAALAGVVVTLLMTPIFSAASSVQIDQAATKITGTEDSDASAAIQDADRFLQTQVGILHSRSLSQMVARDLGFYNNDELLQAFDVTIDAEGLSSAVARDRKVDAVDSILMNNFYVDLPIESRIATLTFESPDPLVSARVANSFAESFIQNNLQRKVDTSAYAREFLSRQLAEARERLAASEAASNSYSEGARILATGPGVDGAAAPTLTAQSLTQINTDLNMATARRITAANEWNAIASVPAMSIPQVNQNPAVQSLVQQLATAQSELEARRARYLPGHPQVIEAQAQFDALRSNVQSLGEQIRRGLRAPYDSSVAAERDLRQRLDSIKEDQIRDQRNSVQLGILERGSQTNRTQYEALLARLNSLNAEAGAPSNNISLVDRADVPDRPIKPSLILNVALSILIGCVLAVLFVLLREQIFGRVRSPDDVERLLALPLLGITPETSETELMADLRDPKSEIAEAYAAIRAVLAISFTGGLPKCLTFTSASAGEGKSVSCMALALATARTGKRVVVLDADMRRPRQHSLFEVDNVRGLSDLLSSNASISETIQSMVAPNLDLITTGPKPPNPAELLAADQLNPLLAKLGENYDHIFIDAPPILGLADAVELANVSDRTILLVRSGENPPARIRSSIQRINLAQSQIAGVILSRFDAKKAGYGADYGYEYNYR
ncbi:polysaccharide biosynthesis tyrosine autokinase [Erythrobacter arachoides]|uniref:non-specific protein-tyrosine kinase n=1 Tax=Aurantiacibacter arachoides TaxID=1850444 RepID=A0A845A1A8_9SPHN|nr:polysaccharide biosynthesis tyrosine autokinase [Aurantiacibacter arachoides]MXO93252.1 polysaccharide biosynthesis tyrosine autokinase [Aurantiacibacter arachoides]GGD50761.1 hypothetical protein GCM10011411_08320 [Aurantiacibacter arachoides]